MLCWWAWIPYVVILGTVQQVQDPAGSLAAAVVAAEHAACGGSGVKASVGRAPDVMGRVEPVTEQEAAEEAVWVGRRAVVVAEQVGAERSVLAVVEFVAAADELAPAAPAWSAGAGGLVGTAAGITALGS